VGDALDYLQFGQAQPPGKTFSIPGWLCSVSLIRFELQKLINKKAYAYSDMLLPSL
jgi:hypothetical protein